jgi:D-glycero-beta-D-manno-heptose 1-phosphate adenylyltransferase
MQLNQATKYKILSVEQLLAKRKEWSRQGKKVVFTNGCFDILHIGHVDYLEKASCLGDVLVIGLNTDASVSRIKGPDRPIVPENARARVIAALSYVDAVVFFDTPTPAQLIQSLSPEVLVKGDDYQVSNIIGADFVLTHGGEVKTIPLVEGFSTSKIIEKIKNT